MQTFWNTVATYYDRLFTPKFWRDQQAWLADHVDGTILDVGCGTGNLMLMYLQHDRHAVAVDLSWQMVRQTQAKLHDAGDTTQRLSVADVTCLPFAKDTFDVVTVTGMLGLLPRDRKRDALKEMARVARQEIWLLEPVETSPGFYMGRVLTFMVDGMRPVPLALFDELNLAYAIEAKDRTGVFSRTRVWQRK